MADRSETRTEQDPFDDLLQDYLPRLRAFVRSRLGADLRRRESGTDVVQSACRELIGARQDFEFRGETEFRGWLFTAVLNKIREKLRFHRSAKRDLRRERDPSEAVDPAASHAAPSHATLAQERVEILEAALGRLGDSDREVLTLARLVGVPVAEIAARQGRSEAAVRKQIGRALHRLAAELEAFEDP